MINPSKTLLDNTGSKSRKKKKRNNWFKFQRHNPSHPSPTSTMSILDHFVFYVFYWKKKTYPIFCDILQLGISVTRSYLIF